MPRVRKGAARHQAKKRVLKAVKGHRGSAGRLYRLAKEAVVRANVNARIDRKRKKRDFRVLWITVTRPILLLTERCSAKLLLTIQRVLTQSLKPPKLPQKHKS